MDGEPAHPGAESQALRLELLQDCGLLSLAEFGGLAVDVPPLGPPLSAACVAAGAGRLFVAASRAVLGYGLPLAGPGCEPELEVPIPCPANHLHCGTLGGRELVVAVHRQRDGATVFLAGARGPQHNRHTLPRPLWLRVPAPTGAAAFAAEGGAGCAAGGGIIGRLWLGNQSDQLCCYRLGLSDDGQLSLHETLLVMCQPSPQLDFWSTVHLGGSAAEVVDIDACEASGRLLASRADGRLESLEAGGWAPGAGGWFSSSPAARMDCAEAPALWGARWLAPRCVLPAPGGHGGHPPPAAGSEWAGRLPGELVRRALLPMLPLRALVSAVAAASRGCQWAVEQELSSPGRTERLAFCFSDCTAWLLGPRLEVLARLDLPFCAAHAQALVLEEAGTVFLAPKTDLVALPGSAIAAAPHLWAISLHRRWGQWRPRLRVRRLPLGAPGAEVAIAAGETTGLPSEEPGPGQAAPRSGGPRHPLGAALHRARGRCRLVTVLAGGELLVHDVR